MDGIDAKILGFVERYIEEHLMCPMLQEIADHVGLSVGSVWARVDRLVEGEYLLKERNCGRSIRPGPKLRR